MSREKGYNSPSSVVKTGQDGSSTIPHPFPSDALQHLVVLSHNHSQECGFIPNMKSTLLDPKRVPSSMVWECLAGHTFSWKPSTPQICTPPSCKAASRGRDEEKEEEKAVSSKPSPPPSPTIRRRRSLRRAAAAHAFSLALASDSPCPVDEAEPSSREDGEGSADRERTGCMSPGSGTGLGKEAELLRGHSTEETAIPSKEIIPGGTKLPVLENTLAPLEGTPQLLPDQREEEEKGGGDEEGEEDGLEEEDNLAYADDLQDENYHPLERKVFTRHKRDYICEFCARSFRTSSNLIIHRRIHTGEKPLQCEICGFTCRQKASLNWHMKKHDADSFYQFSCDLCGKKFEKKDNVTAHKSKSHPEAATGPPQSDLGPPLAVEQLENSGHVQPSDTQEKLGHSPLSITVIIE
ncbi:hypothetical protein JD844_013335 [Phrynosoma platyrhinos]|uniref:C2H2-type domain-containing protein n=1 Tax=Phrynosoma platyrhinos TaxID=52577 RepID=A0ABQ7TLV1_PHRPL|nr:hypothetical protein JD844_013335 [Phrynosoma platyrhinos]